MNIAVVILNWNGKELLKKFLPSVVRFSEEATIYVADNASTDGSIAFLQQQHPEVKLIELDDNFGYAGGYNRALAGLSEDVWVLLNSDVEVTENWLQPIMAKFQANEQIAAIQPKILDYKDRSKFEYAGAAGGFIDQLGYPFCRGRIFQELEKDHGQYDEDVEIFWASGACLAVRNSAYKETGGLDEDFFAHQEEIDLCWRLRNFGYQVAYCGNSRVYHVGGATLAEMNPHKTYLNFRNNLYLLLKNLPKKNLFPVIFIRMVLDGVAAFKFLFEGKFQHFLAVLRAHGTFYANFGRTWKKRSNHFSNTKYYHVASVVYAHYVKRKNKYDQLKKIV